MTCKVVVIEDDPDLLFLLGSNLETLYGCQIICSFNDAIEAMSYEGTDIWEEAEVVVADFMMRKVNGTQFAKWLNEESGVENPPPVIIFTARGFLDDVPEEEMRYVDKVRHKGQKDSLMLVIDDIRRLSGHTHE